MQSQITVELLGDTGLKNADIAIGTCWDKQTKEGGINFERMDRVANKYKHRSTIEHIVYTFNIKGISRLVLQELARHRIASLSVKSSRYTLKELKNEETMCSYRVDEQGELSIVATTKQLERAFKYIAFTGNDSVDFKSVSALEQLRKEIVNGTSNDVAKYCLPESYRTDLVWTINARALGNFLDLRLDKSAHFEIRELARLIKEALPKEHLFLYQTSLFVCS